MRVLSISLFLMVFELLPCLFIKYFLNLKRKTIKSTIIIIINTIYAYIAIAAFNILIPPYYQDATFCTLE